MVDAETPGMQRVAFLAALLILPVRGCVHARPVVYHGPVAVASTELVPINPDVKTVADSAEPVFFHANSFWLFHNGHWWTAPSLANTWTQVATPPIPIIQIDQPYAYTHYRQDHPAGTTASSENPSPPEVATPRRPTRKQPLMPRD
jgi:hypothetical protein